MARKWLPNLESRGLKGSCKLGQKNTTIFLLLSKNSKNPKDHYNPVKQSSALFHSAGQVLALFKGFDLRKQAMAGTGIPVMSPDSRKQVPVTLLMYQLNEINVKGEHEWSVETTLGNLCWQRNPMLPWPEERPQSC